MVIELVEDKKKRIKVKEKTQKNPKETSDDEEGIPGAILMPATEKEIKYLLERRKDL